MTGTEGRAVRFLLILFLGFIGSIVINHTNLRPKGFKSRTLAILFLGMISFGIYSLVVLICQFSFDTEKEVNVGYYKI